MTTTGEPASVLLSVLGPDLYRENAFRVTGLRVDATTRDIRRWSQEWQVKNRLGADMPHGSAALPLNEPPDEGTVQRALQRLRDPTRRIVDELFWFWPLKYGETDEAMAAVDGGDLAAAAELWTRQVMAPGNAPIPVHNLAVLHHALALDRDDDDAERDWNRAFLNWSALLAGDGFWNFLRARVRDLDDARLTPRRAEEMREELGAKLPSINATLATRAARNGRRDEAARHVGLLRRSAYRFGEDAVDRALSDAVAPEVSRVRTLCQNAEDGADAEPRTADKATLELLSRARPVLDELAMVLESGHPLLDGASDEVARRGLMCVIAYTNETGEWRTAHKLLKRVRDFAVTDTIRERIDSDLTTIKNELDYVDCWFCRKNRAVDAHAVERRMYGDVVHEYGRVTWRTGTFRVPRCATCASAHSRANARGYSLGCGGSLVMLVLAIVVGSRLGGSALVVVGIIAAVAIFFGGWQMTFTRSSRGTVQGFPPIREKLAFGWQFGEKPPT